MCEVIDFYCTLEIRYTHDCIGGKLLIRKIICKNDYSSIKKKGMCFLCAAIGGMTTTHRNYLQIKKSFSMKTNINKVGSIFQSVNLYQYLMMRGMY